MAHLAQAVEYTTVRAYLSAVRHLHISQGLANPMENAHQLELVLKGVKRGKPKGRDRRLPITPLILLEIWSVVNRAPTEYTNIMMWAACCLGYFAFLRCGEFTVSEPFDRQRHLEVDDVAVDNISNPAILSIFLKQSKTDQERTGIRLFVGRTHKQVCPIAAMLAYLTVRKGRRPGPLFTQEGGDPLSRRALVGWLKTTLQAAGIDPLCFSGHSFRIGAASTAASKGIEDSTIQTLGRWKSETF